MKYSLLALTAILVLSFGCLGEFCGTKYAYACGKDGKTYTDVCAGSLGGPDIAYPGRCKLCNDTDDGKNIFMKGTVTAAGRAYDDYCSSGARVTEYYCEDQYTSVNVKSTEADCPSGFLCKDGRCLQSGCTGSQSLNLYQKGNAAAGSTSGVDFCRDAGTVVKYYCSGSELETNETACPNGYTCLDGACQPKCTSTAKAGLGIAYDVYTKDIVAKGDDRHEDSCLDSSHVTDYYCLNDEVASQTAACPANYVCSNGACVSNFCYAMDNTKSIWIKGTVRKGPYVFADYCVNTSQIGKYYCGGNEIMTTFLNCPSGYLCSSGACVSSVGCYDSDGGANKLEQGTVTKGGVSRTDYCLTSGTVQEYYCDSKGETASSSYQCDAGYYCSNGACVRSTDVCYDSDGGVNIYDYGYAYKNGVTNYDSCIDSYSVKEYYCSDNKVYSTVAGCPSGYACSGGKCAPQAPCYDSDNGQDTETYGYTYKDGTYSYDYCVDGLNVREYYCSNGNSYSSDLHCPSNEICSAGRCVRSSCTDSDGGVNIYDYGYVTKNGVNNYDQCLDSRRVLEYYCSGDSVYSSTVDCPSGYDCLNGRCAASTTTCTDSDNGANIYSTGHVTKGNTYVEDDCYDATTVREYDCSSSGDVTSSLMSCPSGYVCALGSCVRSSSPGCTDTDGGQNVYTYGDTWDTTGTRYSDRCSGDYLIEGYCSGNTAHQITLSCPSGYACSGGKCMLAPACTDSDGGDYPSMKGTVTTNTGSWTDTCSGLTSLTEYNCDGNSMAAKGYTANNAVECWDGHFVEVACNAPNSGDIFTKGTAVRGHDAKMDYCLNNGILVKYSCVNNQITPASITCANGCSDGACLLSIPPIQPPHLP